MELFKCGLITVAAAIAAALLSSCSFDFPVKPDGYKAVIREVYCNNEVVIVFDETEEWQLPPGCSPVQRVSLAGVRRLRLPNQTFNDPGGFYALQAKAYVERFKGETVYFESVYDSGYATAGYGAVPGLLYFPYDSYADKTPLNLLVLKNGCGLYDPHSAPEDLRWEFGTAAEEAKTEKRGMYGSGW